MEKTVHLRYWEMPFTEVTSKFHSVEDALLAWRKLRRRRINKPWGGQYRYRDCGTYTDWIKA